MEERFRRRQEQGCSELPLSGWQPPVQDNSQFSEEQRAEAWRQLHATHLDRQTSAIESIRTYVAVWFWLSIVGAILYVVAVNAASPY